MKKLFVCLLFCLAGSLSAANAWAGLAEQAARAKVAGIDVIVYPTNVKNVVTLRGYLSAGDAFAGDNRSVPALTGMMLDRGTARQDQFAIAQKLENAGVRLGYDVRSQTVGISGQLRKQNLALVVGTLAEQLRVPAFQPDEFEKARQQYLGTIQGQLEDVEFRVKEAFQRAAYPEGHPNRPAGHEALMSAAKQATLDQVKAFHKAHYGPTHMTMIFVGDVQPGEARREVERAFAGWSGGTALPKSKPAPQLSAAQDIFVKLQDKSSLMVMLGQPSGLRYQDADALALRVGTAILGSGFTGRLMNTVRDEEGLTYGIGASLSDDAFSDGSWAITSTFAPELVDRGIGSIRRELRKWWSDGVTAAELQQRKQNLIGAYQVGLASTEGIASAIQATLERGYDLSWLDEYPKAVQALSLEQVNGAIKRYLAPEKMVLVKAGSRT